MFVRKHQAAGVSVLAADEDLRRAGGEDQIGVGIADVSERAHVLITQTHLNRGVAGNLEGILREGIARPVAQLHLRDACLALFYRGESQKEAGQRGTGAVVGGGLRRVTVGELVVAAVLKESPHRPDEAAIAAAEFQAVTAMLPTEEIAALDHGVPSA